jgi:hypothetical protein
VVWISRILFYKHFYIYTKHNFTLILYNMYIIVVFNIYLIQYGLEKKLTYEPITIENVVNIVSNINILSVNIRFVNSNVK